MEAMRPCLPTEADAAAMSAIYDRDGELSAAIELRRRFPRFTDNAKARKWVRTIAAWKLLPMPAKRAARRTPGAGHGSVLACALF